MRILPLVALLACLMCQAWAQDEEARPVPARGLLKRGPPKSKATTTTTTPAPQNDEEYDNEEEYPQEEEEHDPSAVTEAPSPPPSSTTEGKKLVSGGVRPFRSNLDLIEALKKRRAQAAEAKLHTHLPSSTPSSQDEPTDAPVKANFNSKKRFNSGSSQSNNEESPATSKPSRGRFGKTVAARSVQEAEPEEQSVAAPPARNARFSRRGGK